MVLSIIKKLFPAIHLGIDTICFYILYYLITILRTGSPGNFFDADQILFTMVACNALSVYLVGGYEYQKLEKSARFVSEHILASIIGAIFSLFIILLFVSYAERVGTNRTALIGTFILFSLYSIFCRSLIGHIKSKRKKAKCTVIVGSDFNTFDLLKEIQDTNFQEKIYLINNDFNESLEEKFESIGIEILTYEEFDPDAQSLQNKTINKIILAAPMNQLTLDKEFKEKITQRHLQRNDILSMENFFLSEFRYVPIKLVDDSWPFEQGFRITKNLAYSHAKRAVDIFLSLVVLILASPAILISMFAVKLTSKGPVFFKQTRIGAKETPFTLLKLRTMQMGSDKKGDYTQENDPRITPIGNFLRKSRLDELPQLFNVIKGDMSLIGPRAEWDKLVKNYEEEIPHYHLRHISKPGITGWAQVNYPYGANLEDTINKLKYDLYYVRYCSLTMDLTIIIKTAYTMLFGRGR